MVTTTHSRKGKTIIEIATKKKKTYKSHNEAKRASAAIQLANGGLGCGAVVLLGK